MGEAILACHPARVRMSVPLPDPDACIYRFAGVHFDLRRQTLHVDGAAVVVKPLTLRLLRLLCEANGRVLTRDELFAALWPGGQDVSDAALSQQIWRLRTALGPYASTITTLRRNGLRLDAVVTVERISERIDATPVMVSDALPDASPALAEPLAATPAAPLRQRTRRAGLVVAILTICAIALVALWQRDPLVSDGYGLRVSDVQASRSDTPPQIATALNAALTGHRAHAEAIMRSVHDSDASTPIPALMLGSWAMKNDPDAARRWFDHAKARLSPNASPYLRRFVGYMTARSLQQPVAGQVDALLDLRPDAWLLQHTRSHAALVRRDFPTALAALRAIPLDVADTALLADALADRVSLGDDAAQGLSNSVPALRDDPVLSAYLRGRFAWSHQRPAEAAQHFEHCAQSAIATVQHANDSRTQCTRFAALAAAEAGSGEAVRLADAAARLTRELGYFAHETDMWGLEAFLAIRADQADVAREALDQAWKRSTSPVERTPLLLIALQNGLPVPEDVEPISRDLPIEPVFGGVRQLLLAWAAWSRGDRAESARQLDLALERGINDTWHAEDAALLAARLGRETIPCRLDPPYPNPLRLTACIALRDLKHSQNQ